jgi:Protein of unknown function (DUF3275)
MQKLPGALLVERFNGRKGSFNSGTLETSLGRFKVSDSALDQFAPGTYEGEFLVTRIYIKTTTWRDAPFIKLMADVAQNGYLIFDSNEGEDAAPTVAVEPDDIDSGEADSHTKAPATLPPQEQTFKAAQTTPATEQLTPEAPKDETALIDLFGIELAPLVQSLATPIKLDPTVGRSQLRLQADHLKTLGYRFDAGGQQWNLKLPA